jgi:hypothetical protein
LGGVDALGERETPLECAVRELADKVVLAGAVRVGLAVAVDGEDIVIKDTSTSFKSTPGRASSIT